jgi:hypothetical protein
MQRPSRSAETAFIRGLESGAAGVERVAFTPYFEGEVGTVSA